MKIKIKTGLKIALLSVASTFFVSNAYSESAVIVNPANGSQISKEEIADIYLGKLKRFSNGEAVLAVDHQESADIRTQFLQAVLDKNPTQMKSYWSRLIFTGKGVPPEVMENDAEIVKYVSKNPGAIGYIETQAVTDKVKVILTF